MNQDLRIIVPIGMDASWPTKESIVEEILERYNNYEIKTFCLAAPFGGWRGTGYPSKERYREFAELFLSVKTALKDYDIELGWWIVLTVKNGGGFTPIIKDDGTKHPFACCPSDPKFIQRFSEDVAMFAKIAKPSFIITEDDFSVRAASGCYCDYHLNEFARRMGKRYSREEILGKYQEDTPEAVAFVKTWRTTLKDSLVNFAATVRRELDKESPEIPMGCMQPGCTFEEGDGIAEIAGAFAGENHTPFVRFYGAPYGLFDPKKVPSKLFPALYEKQHIEGDFCFLHESDTYPRTRFFRSGKQMAVLMGSVYSYGFDGSTFQANQNYDDGGEELAYAKMLKKERKRFTVASNTAKQCELKGVEICFDPLYNSYAKTSPTFSANAHQTPNKPTTPCWLPHLGSFGIPYSTKTEPVAFWDVFQATYADNDTVKKYLSKTLFLDATAAKVLCKRGFGKHLGISVGEPVLNKHERLLYDLAAREIICEPFRFLGKGTHIICPHNYCVDGNGTAFEVSVTDEKCEILTELYSYQKEYITPLMTRFENELGGKVIVFGITVDHKNYSCSLLNYRKQRLIQHLITWGNDAYVFVKNEPHIFVIQNEAKDEVTSGFKGMITLTNLGEDDLESVELHLPPHLKQKEYQILNRNGEWEPANKEETADGIVIHNPLNGLDLMYLLIK